MNNAYQTTNLHLMNQQDQETLIYGDFALQLLSDTPPTFQAGDLLEVKPADFTADMQYKHGVIICKEGSFILGRAGIEKDGTGFLYNNAMLTPFTPDEFVGYVVAVRRILEPTTLNNETTTEG